MTEREKYETYRKMFDKAQELTNKVNEHLPHVYSKIYSVFIAVGDEEKGLYFVDIEAGGSPKTYFHTRTMLTEEKILKNYC